MKWRAIILSLAVMASGCGGNGAGPESEAAVPSPTATVEPSTGSPANVMEDMEWHLFPDPDTPAEGEKPILSIWAERVTGMGDDSTALAIEDVEAVVPAQAPDDREIHFSAARGVYEEGKGARLEGGVVATIDDMTIELEAISWEIAPDQAGAPVGGLAASDAPLKITSPTQSLEASSLRLFSESKTLELRGVTGEITFSGETP